MCPAPKTRKISLRNPTGVLTSTLDTHSSKNSTFAEDENTYVRGQVVVAKQQLFSHNKRPRKMGRHNKRASFSSSLNSTGTQEI
jgi:hypothetical protein